MSCSKNKTNSGCGCGDKYLTTPCSCQENICEEDSCPEAFDSKCILYLGKEFSSGNFSVKTGESVNDIIQKMCVYVNDTSVDSSTIPCGIKVVKIKSDSVKVLWNDLEDKDMNLMYMCEGDYEWTETAVTGNAYILQNLHSNMNYSVKIKNMTDSVESVVVNFKTLE